MQERGKIGKLLIFIEARHLTVIIRRCRMQLLVCFHQVAVTKKEKMVEAEKVLLKRQHHFPPSTAFPSQVAGANVERWGVVQVVRRHTSYKYNDKRFLVGNE